MALHEKNTVRENLLDDIFASSDLSVRMPKYKFPKEEHDPRHVYQVVHDELMLDGNSRQNLATFCLHLDGAGNLPAHGRLYRQEHDRQG